MLRHLDLFSGIGGFSLAVDRVWKDAKHTFCEVDPFCQKVLKRHWPKQKIYADIKKFKPRANSADLITGGFPCQPFSHAAQGKEARKGTEDNRYLWPEMLRVIRIAKPKWVVAENVYGLITWGDGVVFEQVLSDLEANGYAVQAFVIPACATDAPHRRDRLWIVANSGGERRNKMGKKQKDRHSDEHIKGFETFWSSCSSLHLALEPDWNKPSSGVNRNDDGLSKGMDRLKALGNAIVPQVATEIFKAIKAL